MASGSVVSAAELRRRTIKHDDYVSCDEAFIDCRSAGSQGKKNYSIIGLGVSQSSTQVVNLAEPHGFSFGAAAMPPGVTNSLHLHFTAEVFINLGGRWNLRWGRDGIDGELPLAPGGVISIPTWIFRGFTNVGDEETFLFTVLGRDDNGGIVWAPSVLEEASRHGLYLTSANQLLEIDDGAGVPDDVELTVPVAAEEVAKLRHWSPQDMRRRCASEEDLRWSARAFVCNGLPGGNAELAQVIGYGMTEDRDQPPTIAGPHSFSLAWLRAAPGEGVLRHRHDHSQVLLVHSGRWKVVLNEGAEEVAVELEASDTLSVPAGAWRSFQVISEEPGRVAVINGGDERVQIEWSEPVRWLASEKGVCVDADGYLAPWPLARTRANDD